MRLDRAKRGANTGGRHWAVILAMVLMLPSLPLRAEESLPGPGEPGFGVRFNQHMIEALEHAPDLEIDDPIAVFRHVFAAVPDQASVYPTENYYYFSFLAGGVEYAGNLRLDFADRDDGVLHFAYFPRNTPWGGQGQTHYRALTGADGVRVEKLAPLRYAVRFEGRGVQFLLNDLSGVSPPPGAVREGERYLGPVFDESGIGFFLLFDEERKEFLFVLDERNGVNDAFQRLHRDHPALTLGTRTGFAVYEDRFAPRKILVGVHAGQVELNTHLDGPFDQLPDNFIEDDALLQAILGKHPELEGQIDRLGGFHGQSGRFLVNPYLNYWDVRELEGFLRCGDAALDEERFYACILPPERD